MTEYHLAILICLFASCTSNGVQGTYESYWGDSYHSLTLNNNQFNYKLEGHIGFDKINGPYTMSNDTLRLLSDKLIGFTNTFLILNDNCLIDLDTKFDYCKRIKNEEWETKHYPLIGWDENRIYKTAPQEIYTPAFQNILDSAAVEGSILIYNVQKNSCHSNNFEWSKKGRLPASTFKIPNTIIGLETGVIKSDSSIFKWNGDKRNMSIWEQDLSLRDAFHFSCVPCYQDVAKKIGVKRMNAYLDTLEYNQMIVNEQSLDIFWLEGWSKISQFEQIDFLNQLYNSDLAISQRTQDIVKELMTIEKNNNYKLSGKTGWSIRNGNNNGWFVGYVEVMNDVYFFATNISPTDSLEIKDFAGLRKAVTLQAFQNLGLIP